MPRAINIKSLTLQTPAVAPVAMLPTQALPAIAPAPEPTATSTMAVANSLLAMASQPLRDRPFASVPLFQQGDADADDVDCKFENSIVLPPTRQPFNNITNHNHPLPLFPHTLSIAPYHHPSTSITPPPPRF